MCWPAGRDLERRDAVATGVRGRRARERSNVGALAAGRRADIVVLDLEFAAVRRPQRRLASSTRSCSPAPANRVRDVMVGGRWLVQDRRHFAETAIAAGYKRAMQQD